MSNRMNVLCDDSRHAGIWDLKVGKPAGGFVRMEKKFHCENRPRGAIWDNIFVVNGCVFDNIFVYFTEYLTINIWGYALDSPRYQM